MIFRNIKIHATMSEAHIPQPNTAAAAPAEIFSSTDSAPHGPTVSAIGTAGGPSSEGGQHAGQYNGIDPIIREQFIHTTTFSWNVTQTPGTLLWSVPIHPNFMTPQIAHLSRMYNAWFGGAAFNIKIAGTGFHAGAIMFVRIPPNRNPREFTTPTSFTNFEYQVIDPKTLEIASFDVMDQRNIMYHYMGFDPNNTQTFGGYLACYVSLGLNTSATGSTEIDVMVLQKPGMTFGFAQLMNPEQPITQNSVPADLQYALDFSQNLQSSYYRAPYDALYILPASTKILDQGIAGTVGFDGSQISKMKYDYRSDSQVWLAEASNEVPPIWQFVKFSTSDDNGFPPYGPVNGQTLAADGKFLVFTDDTSHIFDVSKTYNGTNNNWNWESLTLTLSDTQTSPTGPVSVHLKVIEPPKGDTPVTLPVSTESFFVIGQSVDGFKGTQNYTFSKLLSSGRFKNLMPVGTALLFSLIDIEFSIPVAFVKIYQNGIMSTNSVEALVQLSALTHRLEFFGYIIATDPIPKDPIVQSNFMNAVIRSNQRRIMKAQNII
jgi:hypothetical protein